MLTTRPVVRRLKSHEAADVLDAVFDRLSLESRRLRFHTPMPRLPAYARTQLSQVDDWSHVAVAAFAAEVPVAIGRFVCATSEEAEAAVEVVDDWQGCGIGAQLLEELTLEARALGYRRLLADVLPENFAMLRLLRKTFPDARVSRIDGVIRVTCPITVPTDADANGVPAQRHVAVSR